MLENLALYYAGRFGSAMHQATREEQLTHGSDFVTESFSGPSQPRPFQLQTYLGWKYLASSPESAYYKPFTERLRMHSNTFHWSNEFPLVEKENLLDKTPTLEIHQPTVHPKSVHRLSHGQQFSTSMATAFDENSIALSPRSRTH